MGKDSTKGSSADFTLLNKEHIVQGVQFVKADIGHVGAQVFDSQGNMYQIGENYFGQRGSGDIIANESEIRKVVWEEST